MIRIQREAGIRAQSAPSKTRVKAQVGGAGQNSVWVQVQVQDSV